MSEFLDSQNTRPPEQAAERQPVSIPVNHFELARRGVAISVESRKRHSSDSRRGMDQETADRYLSIFARLGNQSARPKPLGVNGAGEGSQ